MRRGVRLVAAAATLFLANGIVGPAVAAGLESGISQLVQTRNGQLSCRGVIITLRRTTFKARILANQLEIREAKHDSDLRGAMIWAVDEGGKRLTIQWQPDKGDFGSGNAVRVCIERSGFAVGAEPPNGRECWSIGTDPL